MHSERSAHNRFERHLLHGCWAAGACLPAASMRKYDCICNCTATARHAPQEARVAGCVVLQIARRSLLVMGRLVGDTEDTKVHMTAGMGSCCQIAMQVAVKSMQLAA